jgi:hypothetical protein
MIGINSYMKTFYPTHLYIKTHNKTGLKYFGKTTKDPYRYRGSGKRWLAHLKKHDTDISTDVLGYYINKQECLDAAMAFSKENNIVESVEWANMIDENGVDGGATRFGPHSDATKKKISSAQIGKKLSEEVKNKIKESRKLQDMSHMKKTKSEEHRQKISKSLTGRNRSPESIAKTADALRGRKRPEAAEWMKHRVVSDDTKNKMSAAQKGKVVSEETKNKIRKARKLQVITQETKNKLKGKIVCINQFGVIMKIEKELFYSQIGEPIDQEWVFHNSAEGKRRKENRN